MAPQAIASQMRYSVGMKTASIPSVRVEPELRAEVEALLGEGETLSEFVETSIREKVERRRVHEEFIARGLRSVDADVVLANLQRKLDAERSQVAKKRK
jgi:predicted transcriptional regulator